MLRIIIELHPFGDSRRKTEIATMDLWNTGKCPGPVAEYEAASIIEPSPWNDNPELRGGKVVGHQRNLPVWTLVAKMLKELGYSP